MFSYFLATKPSDEQLESCDDVYLMTPNGQWNPHLDVYERNEESMLDWQGNMVEEQERQRFIVDELPDVPG